MTMALFLQEIYKDAQNTQVHTLRKMVKRKKKPFKDSHPRKKIHELENKDH